MFQTESFENDVIWKSYGIEMKLTQIMTSAHQVPIHYLWLQMKMKVSKVYVNRNQRCLGAPFCVSQEFLLKINCQVNKETGPGKILMINKFTQNPVCELFRKGVFMIWMSNLGNFTTTLPFPFDLITD